MCMQFVYIFTYFICILWNNKTCWNLNPVVHASFFLSVCVCTLDRSTFLSCSMCLEKEICCRSTKWLCFYCALLQNHSKCNTSRAKCNETCCDMFMDVWIDLSVSVQFELHLMEWCMLLYITTNKRDSSDVYWPMLCFNIF